MPDNRAAAGRAGYGRPAIKNRYTERVVARTTRHTYSERGVIPVLRAPARAPA